MLRDQNEDLSRSRKRIKILLGLLSKEDDLKGMCSLAARGSVAEHLGEHQNTGDPKVSGPCCSVDKVDLPGNVPRVCVYSSLSLL